MGEREALLRAICENPDDDTPRLVFADWLEENGEPERAEFIRVQCELAAEVRQTTGTNRLSPDWRHTADLQDRQEALWKKHGPRWRAELPQWPGVEWYEPTWSRGFTAGVRTRTLGLFLDFHEAIFAAAPVRHLWIAMLRSGSKLIDCAPLTRLTVLTLERAGMNDRVAEDLLRSKSLGGLKLLDLGGNLLSKRMRRRLTAHFNGSGVYLIIGYQRRPRV